MAGARVNHDASLYALIAAYLVEHGWYLHRAGLKGYWSHTTHDILPGKTLWQAAQYQAEVVEGATPADLLDE